MAREIDQHVITAFSAQIDHIDQQIEARLKPFAIMKSMNAEDMAYDGLGDVEFRELTGDINKTVFADVEALRRQIITREFEVTLPVPLNKAEQVLMDPNSEFAKAIASGANRVFDRVGIEALLADVKTGKKFGTTKTFAADGGNTVNATAGFTYEKYLEIEKFWIDAEVGNDNPVRKALLYTGDEWEDLMAENEFINFDFTRRVAVDAGQQSLDMVGDMETLKYGASTANPLLAVSGGVRDCIAIAGMALAYGIQRDLKISVKDRPDLVEVEQIQATIQIGAVRTLGKRVQKVQTTD